MCPEEVDRLMLARWFGATSAVAEEEVDGTYDEAGGATLTELPEVDRVIPEVLPYPAPTPPTAAELDAPLPAATLWAFLFGLVVWPPRCTGTLWKVA
jgi:hypothetical protein